MIIRREFVALLGGAAVASSISWPLAARAQQAPSKIPLVGVLWHAASAEEEEVYLSVLRKAFRDRGYIEGKNIQLEQRFPAENPESVRTLARELVEAHPAASSRSQPSARSSSRSSPAPFRSYSSS